MAHIYVSTVIDADVDEVWAVARDFTGHWHSSVIADSFIEAGRPSDQVGCVRAFELAGDGGHLREVLVGLSDEEHEFSYRILDAPLPVSDYLATVRFRPITVGRAAGTAATFAEWTADFRVAPVDEDATVDTVRGVFEGGFADLAAIVAPAERRNDRPANPRPTNASERNV